MENFDMNKDIEGNTTVVTAGKKSLENIIDAEKIIGTIEIFFGLFIFILSDFSSFFWYPLEAIELCQEDEKKWIDYELVLQDAKRLEGSDGKLLHIPKPDQNPLMMDKSREGNTKEIEEQRIQMTFLFLSLAD